jgi:hypothetical protein
MQPRPRRPVMRWRLLFRALLVVIASAAAMGAGTATTPTPKRPRRTCTQLAYQFRELLEPVVEASIDGQRDLAGPTAARVLGWWKTHHAEIRLRASADSLVPELGAAGQNGRPLEAARLAVVLADASFNWCNRPPTVTDQLMRIDLTGMTGWLRAQGVALDWPAGSSEATAAVLAELRSRGQASLADSLDSATSAVMQTPVAVEGDAAAARRLLDLVDVVEARLR